MPSGQKLIRIIAVYLTVIFCQLPSAGASPLVFQGQNAGLFPSANPNSTAILMNSVPKKNATASTTPSTGLNTSMLIQNAIISNMNMKITEAIFGDDHLSGNFDLGNGNSISYLHSDGNIIVTIINPNTGTTTIVVPEFIAE
ncbi:MAG: hypothetical protein HGB06_05300 [Chlorobaculum sp.]|jgi:hypothetical protein|nr:hypothetical protein [Chlorobaculum sp.]